MTGNFNLSLRRDVRSEETSGGSDSSLYDYSHVQILWELRAVSSDATLFALRRRGRVKRLLSVQSFSRFTMHMRSIV